MGLCSNKPKHVMAQNLLRKNTIFSMKTQDIQNPACCKCGVCLSQPVELKQRERERDKVTYSGVEWQGESETLQSIPWTAPTVSLNTSHWGMTWMFTSRCVVQVITSAGGEAHSSLDSQRLWVEVCVCKFRSLSAVFYFPVLTHEL